MAVDSDAQRVSGAEPRGHVAGKSCTSAVV